jgi:hypothetical protein
MKQQPTPHQRRVGTPHQRRVGVLAAVAVATLVATATPAVANDDDVIRRGDCSGASSWKLKAGPDDGRIEVEGEVDSNRSGQRWHWRIVHNGSLSAHGVKTTQPPSGSFEVERKVVNLRGTDELVFRAKNRRSGEVCRGIVRI